MSVALGLGVGLAFFVFPAVGEGSFWIRSAIVFGAVLVGAGIGAAIGPEMPISYALGGLLVYVLVSLAWGLGSRWLGLVLGGIAAPALAVLLLPYPADGGKTWVWSAQDYSAATVMLCMGLAFGVVALVAPPARAGARK